MAIDSNDFEAQALDLFDRSLQQRIEVRVSWIMEQKETDLSIRERALELLAFDQGSGNAMQTGQALQNVDQNIPPPKRIGVYKVVERIGQGGMGTVYRGVRDSGDFKHDVAIKLIKPTALSDKLIDRFQRERQVLADFSHPNIASLFDGGTTTEGSPYIIMEYIDGRPIIEWSIHENLNEMERLDLFSTVCDAVHYAHQNLIIHRDITPNNVLVTHDGTVKLIDFGIAKPLEVNQLSTEPQPVGPGSLISLSFTPGFAAPERSQGGSANTLSDIYSLGKLLENLIVLSAATAELNSIIVKATQADPQDRYTSVEALREDIARYKTNFPVEAFTQGPIYRTKKFLKRHSMGVFFSAVLASIIIGSLVTTTTLYKQAEKERKNADKRFNETREIANFMLFELYDQLRPVTGNTLALNNIADKSKSYMEILETDKRADASLRLDIAISNARLSAVMGNPKKSNLGRRDEAAVLLKKAYSELEILHHDFPENTDVIRAKARAAYDFATHEFYSEDDTEKTRQYAQISIDLFKAIIDKGDAVEDDYLEKMTASQQYAETFIWDNMGQDGIDAFEKLRNQILAYTKEHPESLKAKILNASIHSEYANTMSWHYDEIGGDQIEALEIINYAIGIYESLDIAENTNSSVKRNLASVYWKRAVINMSWDDWTIIQADLERAEANTKALIAKDPKDESMTRMLRTIHSQMVPILGELGEFDRAIALGENNHMKAQAAYRADSTNIGRFRQLAVSFYSQGVIYKHAGQTEQACKNYRMALQSLETLENNGNATELDKANIIPEVRTEVAECDKH